MSIPCLAERLGGMIRLTSSEELALGRLEQRERGLRRGATLVRENERPVELFVLRRGTMMSYVLLDDGSRQILRFFFRGDLVGWAGLPYTAAPETVVTLSDCDICPVDRTQIAQLAAEHPRLIAMLLALSQMERVALTDRLAMLGRTSAKGRVAAVLLEVRTRRQRAEGGAGPAFVLGLTQEEVGDATGLTAVHVNRMFRLLTEEGLISRENGRVTLINEPALVRAANFVDRYGGLDLGWLPPPR